MRSTLFILSLLLGGALAFATSVRAEDIKFDYQNRLLDLDKQD